MNSIQRVAAVLNGETYDRRPVAAILSLYGARLTGRPLAEYYRHPAAYVEGQQAVLEAFRPDILFSPFALSQFGEAFGGTLKFHTNQAPTLKEVGIHAIQDFKALRIPDVDSHPTLLYIRESLRRLVTHVKDEVPVGAFALTPFDLPPLIFGLERWLNLFMTDPEGVKIILEQTTRFFHAWVSALIDDGAKYIFLPGVFVSPAVLTLDLTEERILPLYQEILGASGASFILHPHRGPLLPFLEIFQNLPSSVGIALDARDDLGLSRERIGPSRGLLKGPDSASLSRMTPESVISWCQDLLKKNRHDGRFLLFASPSDVRFDTEPEVIQAMLRAVESEL